MRSAVQKNPDQRGNILAPFTKRRQMNADHVKPVVQVFSKSTFANSSFEFLIGRGDHAHVRCYFLVATHPKKGAIRKHPQQPSLQIQRHVTDFVQKQRSARGLLKTPLALALGTGKRTLLVTKKF